MWKPCLSLQIRNFFYLLAGIICLSLGNQIEDRSPKLYFTQRWRCRGDDRWVEPPTMARLPLSHPNSPIDI